MPSLCLEKCVLLQNNRRAATTIKKIDYMKKANVGHPKGLYVLFLTEMWERFSYYGMRAMFVLYMVKCLSLAKEDASQIYGNYTGLVYLTPLLGGYLADRFWGNRRSILLGSAVMALGQFLMLSARASIPRRRLIGLCLPDSGC